MNKIKLSRKTIHIVTLTGKKSVKAWVFRDLLAWHKENNFWVMTHIITGYKVIVYKGKYKHIRSILSEVAELVDWTIEHDSLLLSMLHSTINGVSLADKIRDIVSKYELK